MQHPKMQMRVQKLVHFKGTLPSYETSGSSGLDIRACLDEDLLIEPFQRVLIPTGLAFEVPHGFELQARPRSGLATKQGLTLLNTPGTIDADYRGEVKIIAINLGAQTIRVKDQDRIAQLVLCPVVQAELVAAPTLSTTDRGAGGFGSTGVSDQVVDSKSDV